MQKTAPATASNSWGGKNRDLFFTGARSLQCRSYATGGARYLSDRPYAPDTREMCSQGPSRVLWYFRDPAAVLSRTGQGREVKSIIARCADGSGCTGSLPVSIRMLHSFVLLRYAETASTEQLPFGLGAAAENVRVRDGKKITCTGRPDESDARNGRLQPAGCARTGSLHARGMRGSDGCNGSRWPAEPDTSRCPQPWRSG